MTSSRSISYNSAIEHLSFYPALNWHEIPIRGSVFVRHLTPPVVIRPSSHTTSITLENLSFDFVWDMTKAKCVYMFGNNFNSSHTTSITLENLSFDFVWDRETVQWVRHWIRHDNWQRQNEGKKNGFNPYKPPLSHALENLSFDFEKRVLTTTETRSCKQDMRKC